jgi:hypothetical protein
MRPRRGRVLCCCVNSYKHSTSLRSVRVVAAFCAWRTKQGAESIAPKVGDSTQNRASIGLADGKLLIRDQNRMMCLKVAE